MAKEQVPWSTQQKSSIREEHFNVQVITRHLGSQQQNETGWKMVLAGNGRQEEAKPCLITTWASVISLPPASSVEIQICVTSSFLHECWRSELNPPARQSDLPRPALCTLSVHIIAMCSQIDCFFIPSHRNPMSSATHFRVHEMEILVISEVNDLA